MTVGDRVVLYETWKRGGSVGEKDANANASADADADADVKEQRKPVGQKSFEEEAINMEEMQYTLERARILNKQYSCRVQDVASIAFWAVVVIVVSR